MAKLHSPVPSFGNWESDDDVSYTAVFEKARKDMDGDIMDSIETQGNSEKSPKSEPPVQLSPLQMEPKPEATRDPEAIKTKHEHGTSQERVDPKSLTDSPVQHDSVDREGKAELEAPKGLAVSTTKHTNQSTREDTKVGVLSSGDTTKSAFGKSVGVGGSGTPSPPRERKSSSEGGSHGLAPSNPWRSRPRSVTQEDDMPEQGATVPKFGDWDDSKAASGEEYSAIFNQVKAERQSRAGRVPAIPSESARTQKPHAHASSKICCWCPWSKK